MAAAAEPAHDLDVGFTDRVVDGGYAWWYVDAVSDDSQHGLTLIAFIGSVFSPYYARARRRGAAALDHVAFNVVLYGHPARWAMTERSRVALTRAPSRLSIGPSRLSFDRQRLVAEFDEIAVPLPRRVRGRIEVTPCVIADARFALDAAGRHQWHPLWPAARVEVTLSDPPLSWHGHAYVDRNHGTEPLENAFVQWHWSRSIGSRDVRVLYDATRVDGSTQCLALAFDGRGTVSEETPPPPRVLEPTRLWRIPRATRSPGQAQVVRTLEDTPFYARSLIADDGAGDRRLHLHESLSLTRFRRPLVRAMLPFRMPRRR